MIPARLRAVADVVTIAPPDRRLTVATLVTGVVALLAGTALLALSGVLISKAALRPPVLALSVLIVLVRAVGLLRALARYGERLASHDLALRALAGVRSTVFSRLVARSGKHDDGDLLSRFVGDVDALQALYLRALAPPAVAAVTSAVTVSAAAILLPSAAVVLALGLLAAGVLVPFAVAAIGRRAVRRQAHARARLSVEILEIARHAPELAVAGRTTDRVARVARADDALRRIAVRDAVAGAAAGGLGTLVQGLTVIAVLAVAVPATGHALDSILLAALAFLALAAFEATAPLGTAAQELAACGAAAERVTAISVDPTSAPAVRAPFPTSGALALEAVTARPAPGATIVLSEADLRIAPGEAVALVGPSGAGKTTLARLFVRFVAPEEGRVTLGGADVNALDPEDLRRAVRLISSDEALFTTTVAENVRLARPGASDDDVRDALRAAGLADWLATLPEGQDTVLGEHGTTVSGGQRRRLAVARALLADARFLIVDEPGEHLDDAGRDDVLSTLVAHAHAHGQGLLAIVHGGTLERFDRVHELRGGRLT